MKLFKTITKGLVPVLASLFVAAAMMGHASAIPYNGDATQAAPSPAFNVYTGVPSEGNESDFFRGKVTGDTNASVNNVNSTCETGKRFTLRVYVHNGADKALNNNGTGPSVAKGTKVKVDLKNAAAASSFNPVANISATSPVLSVNDDMTITCTDGKQVKLSYVQNTAQQFSRGGTQPISNDIVTTGAAIGTDTPNGDVWGCWEQRVYVTLVVEVKEVPKEVPTGAICVIDNAAFKAENRTVTFKVGAQLQNATILAYDINWGDGSTNSTKSSDTHTYAKDGTYTIQGRVQVKLANGEVKWVSDGCAKQVTFKPGQPPVTPPTTPPSGTLTNTGAGNVFGIFAATSFVGALLHKVYLARKASQI